MTRSILLAGAVASCLALAGCGDRDAHKDDAAHGNAAADSAAVADALRAEEVQWNQDFADKNLDRLAGHYAADGYVATPGDAPSTGDAAIRAALAPFIADPNLRLTFAADRVEVSGDLAYTRGHYELQMTDAETRQPATTRGSYLTVWRRQEDGSWKVVEDFLTPGPAAAAAPAAAEPAAAAEPPPAG